MAAESEEVEFMEKLGVGEDSTEEECWRLTGKDPIDTKFVRVDKGSDDKPEVRARLVHGTSKSKEAVHALICSRQCLHWKRRRCFSGKLFAKAEVGKKVNGAERRSSSLT